MLLPPASSSSADIKWMFLATNVFQVVHRPSPYPLQLQPDMLLSLFVALACTAVATFAQGAEHNPK